MNQVKSLKRVARRKSENRKRIRKNNARDLQVTQGLFEIIKDKFLIDKPIELPRKNENFKIKKEIKSSKVVVIILARLVS